MRTSGRMALAQMQDDRVLRAALLARPRRAYALQPNDMVAYWRNQKWVHAGSMNYNKGSNGMGSQSFLAVLVRTLSWLTVAK